MIFKIILWVAFAGLILYALLLGLPLLIKVIKHKKELKNKKKSFYKEVKK